MMKLHDPSIAKKQLDISNGNTCPLFFINQIHIFDNILFIYFTLIIKNNIYNLI